ncbi:MAG: hypothetical protein WC229_02825 [Candidatus Paceibacterota bacterium]|jgi:hypothetical protein
MDNKNNDNMFQSDNQEMVVKALDVNAIFPNDPYGLFVFQKTEKLVAGVYLLTGYLSDKEPLKWTLRDVANTILKESISLSDRVWGEENLVESLVLSISEISAIFGVAKVSSLISISNYEIIKTEFDKLADFLHKSSQNLSSAKIAFGGDLFGGNYDFISNQGYQNNNQEVSENYKGQKDIKDNQNYSVLNKVHVEKKNPTEKKLKDKSNRQEVITSMLKSGVKLTIKDFTKNIKDCSEKTIQRELLALVAKGVLKKEGERRWSKYFLS